MEVVWGWTGDCDTAEQLTLADQGDIPWHMTSCSAITTEEKEEKGSDTDGYGACLSKYI